MDDMDCYDITEFIVYTILPVATYWVVRLIKESLPEKEQEKNESITQ